MSWPNFSQHFDKRKRCILWSVWSVFLFSLCIKCVQILDPSSFFLHDFFRPLRILGKIICLGISRWKRTWIECTRQLSRISHSLQRQNNFKTKNWTCSARSMIFLLCVFLFFSCENRFLVTVWPYCCRHVAAVLKSSVKVTFKNILETFLDQLGFEYEISMFCPEMVSNVAGNLCSLLCFIIVVLLKHAVKSANFCKPFNGWFKSLNFSTNNFRKKQLSR